jgi:hypothetical protein
LRLAPNISFSSSNNHSFDLGGRPHTVSAAILNDTGDKGSVRSDVPYDRFNGSDGSQRFDGIENSSSVDNSIAHWTSWKQLPPWLLATLASVLASTLQVWGFAFMKMAAGLPLVEEVSYLRVGDMVLSPRWIIGLALIVLALICDYLAYSLAPLSLTTPLGGVTVILNNVVLAPCLLGEQVQPWPDALGVILVLFGSVLTTMAGAHETVALTPQELLARACRPACVLLLSLLMLLLGGCCAYSSQKRALVEECARLRPSAPNRLHVSVVAFAAAGMGGIANLALKAGVELIKTPPVRGGEASMIHHGGGCIACLLVAAVAATAQLNYVNRGLRLYMQTVFVPIHYALLVVMNTFYGAVVYEEYGEVFANGARAYLFCLGMMLIIQGICTFTLRKPGATCPDKRMDG